MKGSLQTELNKVVARWGLEEASFMMVNLEVIRYMEKVR